MFLASTLATGQELSAVNLQGDVRTSSLVSTRAFLVMEIGVGVLGASIAPDAMLVCDINGVNFLFFQASDVGGEGLLVVRSVASTGSTWQKLATGTLDDHVFTCFNNRLYFNLQNGANGDELWRSDGTVAGTAMVSDVCAGTCSSSPTGHVVLGSFLYFVAQPSGSGNVHLYRTDGTTTTRISLDATFTTIGAASRCLIPLGSHVYFAATNAADGYELWRSDGTTVGTTRVTTLSNPMSLLLAQWPYQVGARAFFAGTVGSDTELWATDGTTAGTLRLEDNPQDGINNAVLNGASCLGFFFYPCQRSGTVTAIDLCRTDGTTVVALTLRDTNAATQAMWDAGNMACSRDGTALYLYHVTAAHGVELRTVTSTTLGTGALLVDINAGATSSAITNLWAVPALGSF